MKAIILPNSILAKFSKSCKACYIHEVDIDYAVEVLGDRNIIMGNINTTTIQFGRPEEVYEGCRIAIEKGKKMKVYSDENGWPCTESFRQCFCVGPENCSNKNCELVKDYDIKTGLETNKTDTEV